MPKHGDTLGARLVKAVVRSRIVIGAQDSALNKRWRGGEPDILLIRHPQKGPWFYRQFLDWLGSNFPQVRQRFELALLGQGNAIDPSRYRLLVPWLQDPVQAWSMKAYAQACSLAARFEAQGLPVINKPEALANSAKSTMLDTTRALGIRAARSIPIGRVADLHRAAVELGYPFILRPDHVHGLKGVRIEGQSDIDRISERSLSAIGKPVAIEFIDTVSADGLFRKFRYLAAGDSGVNVHLIASRHWEVRGDSKAMTEALVAEERAFIGRHNRDAPIFNALRRALDFDFAAFDYAYDPSGNLVVWEANPYPAIVFGRESGAHRYRSVAVHRCFAIMAVLYLSRAGLDVPAELAALVDDPGGAATRCDALSRGPVG